MSHNYPTSLDEAAEEKFIHQLLEKDQDGLTTLIEFYGPIIFGCLKKNLSSTTDADQVFVRTMSSIVSQISEYAPSKSRLLTWMLVKAWTETSQFLNQSTAEKLNMMKGVALFNRISGSSVLARGDQERLKPDEVVTVPFFHQAT